MTIARRIEGPRAPLFYSGAALLVLIAKVATAQTVDLSTLELCASLETPELTLACFEAIIADATASDVQVPEVAVAVTPENRPVALEAEVAAGSEPVSAPAAGGPEIDVAAAPVNPPAASEPVPVVANSRVPPDATPVVSATPSTADVGRKQPAAPVMAGSQAVPDAAPVASTTPSTEDFGREQLAAGDSGEEKEVLRATVIDVSQGSRNNLYFHLANGQVWRQIESRRFQYPKQGDFEVGISKGMMGDYRLRIGDNGRMVRIRRVQ